MIERFYLNFLEMLKKNSNKKDEKLNPRDVYKSNLSQEISRIENLQIPVNTLRDHLFDSRSPHHYGARCLTILSVGKQIRKGDNTIISVPKPWQRLIGGEKVDLTEIGIKALETSARKFEEAYAVEKLEN